jgi:hypothetical protein
MKYLFLGWQIDGFTYIRRVILSCKHIKQMILKLMFISNIIRYSWIKN